MAGEEEFFDGEDDVGGGGGGGGGGKLLPILLVFNILATAGVGAFIALKPAPAPVVIEKEPKKAEGEGAEGEGGKAALPKVGPTVDMGEYVIRLRSVDADRFARFVFSAQVISEPDAEFVRAKLPELRDRFITHLSDQNADELLGVEGIQKVKTELFAHIQQAIPGNRVRALYLTEFVVQ